MIWNIKSETCKKAGNEGIHMLNITGNITNNHQVISDYFNNHFLSIAQKISNNIHINNIVGSNSSDPLDYLIKIFKNLLSNIKLSYTSMKEIEKMIKSLKPNNSHRYGGISVKL